MIRIAGQFALPNVHGKARWTCAYSAEKTFVLTFLAEVVTNNVPGGRLPSPLLFQSGLF